MVGWFGRCVRAAHHRNGGNRPAIWRALAVLGVLASLLPLGAPPELAAAQGGGLVAVRFEGDFRIDRQPAPAGIPIEVITARSATDAFVCGRGMTRDGGAYTIDVPAADRCADSGNAGGPVEFIFVLGGVRIGGHNRHIDLNRPDTLARRIGVTLSLPVAFPGQLAVRQQLIPVRFYGTFRIDGQPAPAGTPVEVITARSATDTVVCGSTVLDNEGGLYVVDVEATERCADAGNAGGPVQFIFVSRGVRVGGHNRHIDLNKPDTLGRMISVSLSGSQPPVPELPPSLTVPTIPPAPAVMFPDACLAPDCPQLVVPGGSVLEGPIELAEPEGGDDPEMAP
jgi:hypothetical protein